MEQINITEDGVLKLISNVPSNSASGPCLILFKLLNITSETYSVLLSYIYQTFLDSGVVPADWKTATVVSVFKDDSKDDSSNYRPISVLPV